MEGIHLKAHIDSVKIDKEGEAKLVLVIPLIYRKEYLACAELTEKVLDVYIKQEENKSKF